MSNSFQRRISNIIDYLVCRQLDQALKIYNHSARFGNSSQRAFDRLRWLSSGLSELGRTGRAIAKAHGIPTDDEWTDKLPGGKADGKAPSDFEKKDLQEGAEVELDEHTDDYDIALEIAMDHLDEAKNYYPELKKMEKGLKDKEADNEEMGSQTIGDNQTLEPANEELSPTDKSLNAPSRRPHSWV